MEEEEYCLIAQRMPVNDKMEKRGSVYPLEMVAGDGERM
jgi:hypothetical protein